MKLVIRYEARENSRKKTENAFIRFQEIVRDDSGFLAQFEA
jgi:hypothetical protein